MQDESGSRADQRQQDEMPAPAAERIPSENPPIFNLPTGILAALGIVIGIYVLQDFVFSERTNQWVAVEFGFSPIRYLYPLGEQSLAWLWTPVSYSLLHGSFEHLAFNSLWLAAFGTPVCRRIGEVRFLLFWIVSSIAAAALHAVVNWGEPSLMVGASGVISALMGAACRFAFGDRQRVHARLADREPRLLSIGQALSDRTVRVFVIVWFLGNVAIAFGLPMMGADSAAIAWDAHIGGFLLGFFCFALFDPHSRKAA
ncbi:rhomboid family intramembrane serine protease [Rhizobium rhizophilum]|uniref:Rhomboid family intramembrane serine protease n=1 Tax=Rhizobium rhizophilum TaxID=1850373 RepID=A0ABY2QSG6_9HYPH|nr:rhomboid family intramembrane serine protease [Rhizobium rhizophilum]THV13540.1 rhomboid family intramembrane serine protease [Rhizobium rhizophilum]